MLAVMEATPLRSVPARLPEPVNPMHALAQVQRMLPDLAPEARRALALVDLGARPRAEAAAELGLSQAELSRLLAAARKALRRTLAPLPAGGWCERAEILLSDRLDGVLTRSGEARLDAHLGACERCASHELRLAQAHDLLVSSYLEAHRPAPAPAAKAAPAELRVVEETPAPAPQLRAWHAAFVVGLLLVVAAVVLALLAVTDAVNVP
jgi:hypothetical protein